MIDLAIAIEVSFPNHLINFVTSQILQHIVVIFVKAISRYVKVGSKKL